MQTISFENKGKLQFASTVRKNVNNYFKEKGISTKDAFAAIYTSLIGKDHGPKAAWLILSLDKTFVRNRFSEVSS